MDSRKFYSNYVMLEFIVDLEDDDKLFGVYYRFPNGTPKVFNEETLKNDLLQYMRCTKTKEN